MCFDVVMQPAITVGKRWWHIMIRVNNTMFVGIGLTDFTLQDVVVAGSQGFGCWVS